MGECSNKRNWRNILIKNNSYIIFIVLIFICAVLSPEFLTTMNIKNILLQQTAPICVAIGMLFVILTGGIDLSVGAVMAVSSSVSAILIAKVGVNPLVAVLCALGIGLLFGLTTGCLVAFTKMQGFVASLAMMTIARGVAYMITNATPIPMPKNTLDVLVSGKYGYPIFIITLLVCLLFIVVQNFTSYGRIVIALGSNKDAVELAGIRTNKYLISVYALSGVMAALAGIFVSARVSTGSSTIGMGQELDAITACVIGGASLAGGRGEVIKAIIGAFILALIGNIMNLMSVPSYPQDIIKGFIIIFAILLLLFTEKTEKTV